MNLTAVFTAPPQFTVLQGRTEIGRTDPSLLSERIDDPRRLLLAGRNWQVTYIDWRRRRCFVEPVDGGGKAKWSSAGFGLAGSHELTRAERQVLLGKDPPVKMTQRATSALHRTGEDHLDRVHPGGTLIIQDVRGHVRWWTWAGHRANATLAATLDTLVVPGSTSTTAGSGWGRTSPRAVGTTPPRT